MSTDANSFRGRLLVVAFEGWNDAGEAASGAARLIRDSLALTPVAEVEAEAYFDYQFNRPMATTGDDGKRKLVWPSVTMFGPSEAVLAEGATQVCLLLGTEPARGWKQFTAEIMAIVREQRIDAIVTLGAMLADVPHTRPISIYVSSENAVVRDELSVEKSTYEGPVGILSVISAAAEDAGIPTLSIWASVPHYVHNAPSPKATLAILDRLEEIITVEVPRGALIDESAAWESGINALAEDDDDMAQYIEQLEQARDTVDSPEASGEAIAEEFERYLRRRDGKADGRDRTP